MLEAYAARDENFKKKQEEDSLLQEHEEKLNQILLLELYYRIKKYGWVSFQVNAKSITNAYWALDAQAVWHVRFHDNEDRLLITVSQPTIDRAKLKESNTAEIGLNAINFAFTSTCMLPLYVRFYVLLSA